MNIFHFLLRKKEMEDIQKDKTLTPKEKMEKIQELMKRKQEIKSNFQKKCPHYQKNCSQFYFSCCKIYDPCKRCHMERNICKNPILETIQCNECSFTQKPSPSCKSCSIPFSTYYCSICSIWSDIDDIYHCDECGICRRGTRESTFHCDRCGTCFQKSFFENHKCLKTSYKEKECIICHEQLFHSCENSFSLPCSHFIHLKCFQEYISYGNYGCPLCKKSMLDMSDHWNYLRNMIQEHPLEKGMIPIKEGSIVSSNFGKFKINSIKDNRYKGEFIDWKLKDGNYSKGYLSSIGEKIYILIYCNDCLKKSYTEYHHYGLECKHCYGFNTQE